MTKTKKTKGGNNISSVLLFSEDTLFVAFFALLGKHVKPVLDLVNPQHK